MAGRKKHSVGSGLKGVNGVDGLARGGGAHAFSFAFSSHPSRSRTTTLLGFASTSEGDFTRSTSCPLGEGFAGAPMKLPSVILLEHECIRLPLSHATPVRGSEASPRCHSQRS